MVYVIVYRRRGYRLFGEKGDLTAGSHIVVRSQNETDSNILIPIPILRLISGIHLGLNTSISAAIPAPCQSRMQTKQRTNMPEPRPFKAMSGDWAMSWVTAALDGTWLRSGDGNVFESFSGRALSPDHNVGLILGKVLARVSRYNSLSTTSVTVAFTTRVISFPTSLRSTKIGKWGLLDGMATS